MGGGTLVSLSIPAGLELGSEYGPTELLKVMGALRETVRSICVDEPCRPKLLQREFFVGIGPDNQVGNVSFETRPSMWHAAGDDDHIALGEST